MTQIVDINNYNPPAATAIATVTAIRITAAITGDNPFLLLRMPSRRIIVINLAPAVSFVTILGWGKVGQIATARGRLAIPSRAHHGRGWLSFAACPPPAYPGCDYV